MPLSERCDSSADHSRSPCRLGPRTCAPSHPVACLSVLGCWLRLALPSRAGHDLPTTTLTKMGRPSHGVCSTVSPKAALNRAGPGPRWFSRNNSLLSVAVAWGSPRTRTQGGGSPPLLNVPVEVKLGPARCLWVVVGGTVRRTSAGENWAFSPQLLSTYSALGTILCTGMELLTRQMRH